MDGRYSDTASFQFIDLLVVFVNSSVILKLPEGRS